MTISEHVWPPPHLSELVLHIFSCRVMEIEPLFPYGTWRHSWTVSMGLIYGFWEETMFIPKAEVRDSVKCMKSCIYPRMLRKVHIFSLETLFFAMKYFSKCTHCCFCYWRYHYIQFQLGVVGEGKIKKKNTIQADSVSTWQLSTPLPRPPRERSTHRGSHIGHHVYLHPTLQVYGQTWQKWWIYFTSFAPRGVPFYNNIIPTVLALWYYHNAKTVGRISPTITCI